MTVQQDIVFVSHGGGPRPLLGDPDHADMVVQLEQLTATLTKPDAIIVVSAHWEAEVPTITSSAAPNLIYDYSGFPPESYEITYPCPGHPELAKRIADVLQSQGIEAKLDDERGLDHGAFVPLKIMYPEASIPCIQVSLVNSLDAQLHIAIGEALQACQISNLLVIGSGFSFHNMRAFYAPPSPAIAAANTEFEQWLQQTCCDKNLSENERKTRLINWEQAPHSRFCHPREEHLLPLHVCYGMAGKACDDGISATIFHKQASMFHWHIER